MIDVRLKEERERLGLTQPQFALVAGAAKRTLADWEKGVSSPTAIQLSALAKIGADVLYILTGQRGQQMHALRTSSDSLTLDRARFIAAMGCVEEGLSETRRTLPSSKKIELYLAAYELLAQAGESRENVIKLVRLAA